MPTIAKEAHDELNLPPKVHSSKQLEEDAANYKKNQDGKGSLILRIKRKRGTEPISALRIEALLSEGIDPKEVEQHAKQMVGADDANQEDRLESSTRTKRRLTDRGVFRLAETVSVSSFATAKATRQLEQRISELKNTPTPASTSASPILPQGFSSSSTSSDPTKVPMASTKDASSANSSTLRFQVLKPASSRQAILGALKGKSSSGSLRSRASQLKNSRNASKSSLSSLRKTTDTSGNQRKSPYSSKLRFIDAVMERSVKGTGNNTKTERGQRGVSTKAVSPQNQNVDSEMELLDKRFADLLGNYLEENNMQPPADLYKSTAKKDQYESPDCESEDSEDEYVYDIYFREKESMWGSGPAGPSDAGLRPAEVAGHEIISTLSGPEAGKAVAAEQQYPVEPMATLVGFSDEDDLINEMENASRLMAQEVPNDSSDEFDEGEDEDSNDEGFYRNDYPEDEGEEEEEFNQAGWGWSGPRRRGQRASSDDEDEEDGDNDDNDSDDLHS